MLTSDYRVCAGRPCVGVPRCFMENRVRDGIRSGGIGGEPRRFWRRTPWSHTVYESDGSVSPTLREQSACPSRRAPNVHLDGCANLLRTPGAAPQEKARARDLLEKACAAGIARGVQQGQVTSMEGW